METLISIIQEWGYVAVFLGALVEGESIILTASFLASQGYLSLEKIMLVAFCATLFADQALFQVGRLWGNTIIDALHRKWPSSQRLTNKAFYLLQKYKTLYILSFRFILGIRIISPIIIGSAGIPVGLFTLLNFIAAVIWVLLSCLGGYYVGYFLVCQACWWQKILIIVGIVGAIGLKLMLMKRVQRYIKEKKRSS